MAGVTLDTGALIAVERADPRMHALLEEAGAHGLEIAIPAGVLAQAWRDPVRQVRLSRLLRVAEVTVVALDDAVARATGALCGRAGTADVIDASVALCARARDHAVVTSDPGDIAALDPSLRLVRV